MTAPRGLGREGSEGGSGSEPVSAESCIGGWLPSFPSRSDGACRPERRRREGCAFFGPGGAPLVRPRKSNRVARPHRTPSSCLLQPGGGRLEDHVRLNQFVGPVKEH